MNNQDLFWNWDVDSAPKDRRMLGYVPAASARNKVQRVRWSPDHEAYLNDHGNTVEIEAFRCWTDPEVEAKAIEDWAAERVLDGVIEGLERSDFVNASLLMDAIAEEASENEADATYWAKACIAGVTISALVIGASAALVWNGVIFA